MIQRQLRRMEDLVSYEGTLLPEKLARSGWIPSVARCKQTIELFADSGPEVGSVAQPMGKPVRLRG
jgi:hypothetical protein